MKIRSVFLAVGLVSCLTGWAVAQSDGVCTITVDPTPYKYLEDEAALLAEIEFAMAAPLMSESPIADGIIEPGEYANMCTFTYAENQNPGHSWPNLDNLNDGNGDLWNNLYLAHTEDYLFVAFEVTDDYLELDGPNSFQGDGVEIFMNPDNDNGDAWGDGKYQLYVDAAFTNTADGELDPFDNHRGSAGGLTPLQEPIDELFETEFYSAGIASPIDGDYENGGTYVVEFQIPLSGLLTSEGEPMTTGDVMLINTAIDDNDATDDPGGQNGHHLLWHADGAGSPFGAGEAAWNVPLVLSEPAPDGVEGDFNDDGNLTAADVDLLTAEVSSGGNDSAYDLNGDGSVNAQDVNVWVKDLKNTFFGDANVDGEFNSSDFVSVFTTGKYEQQTAAVWSEGDWNSDGRFDSSDFVSAFQDGGYEQGPAAAQVVPEPSSCVLFGSLVGGWLLCSRKRRSRR